MCDLDHPFRAAAAAAVVIKGSVSHCTKGLDSHTRTHLQTNTTFFKWACSIHLRVKPVNSKIKTPFVSELTRTAPTRAKLFWSSFNDSQCTLASWSCLPTYAKKRHHVLPCRYTRQATWAGLVGVVGDSSSASSCFTSMRSCLLHLRRCDSPVFRTVCSRFWQLLSDILALDQPTSCLLHTCTVVANWS